MAVQSLRTDNDMLHTFFCAKTTKTKAMIKAPRLWLGLILPVLFSCVREPMEFSTPVPEGTYELKLFNEIEQLAVTRVNDEGFCNGDAVGVYVVNYQDGTPGGLAQSGNQADNIKFTLDEATQSWKPASPVYYYDKLTHVDIYGYYPYGSPSSVTEYPFEVQRDQSKEAANGALATYEASDFLWAKASDITPTASVIPLQFRHKMAGVVVRLAEGTGFADGEFAALNKAVLVTNTIRTAKINLSSGVVTPTGEVPTTGIVPVVSNGDFRAVVVPQSVAANTPLFMITVDGLPYTFRKNEAMEYVPGKLHKFTISISKKSDSGLEFTFLGEAITPWENDAVSHDGTAREYIVVNCPEGGKLKETLIADGKDYSKIKNLKVTGTINEEDYYFMRDEMTVLQGVNLKSVTSIVTNYYDFWGEAKQNGLGIPIEAFQGKLSLVRVVLPESIQFIGQSAFGGSNLTGALTIPDGVTEIHNTAFVSTPLVGTLSLPNSLIILGDGAFGSCKQIYGNLDLPQGVTYIGSSCFEYCTGISGELILPEKLYHLGWGAFRGTRITGSIRIPEGITSISDQVFYDCEGLNGELILPRNLTHVGAYAFYQCHFRYPLHLPDGLLTIGSYAFAHCSFSGQLILPESLVNLGELAFASNLRMSGVLVLPPELLSIPAEAFENCRNLEGIVIPRNVEYIGRAAFNRCYQITSITSYATTPPAMGASVFDGVGKDNMTVEVPEYSVNDYITAVGWNEFKRFSAHREFSVSRNLFRTLNAQNNKELLIRAPASESWSVESKPDWVEVIPSSGTGNTEITITAGALAQNAGNREGEVVFLLDGKDYRVRTRVEQYDYLYGDGDVIVHQTHTKGNGVNLVFIGDCFDAKDIAEGKYTDAMEEAIGYYFAIEPYKTYKDYFNVYSVVGLSPDSGVGDVNTIREARFGTQYTLDAGLAPDSATCFEAACLAPIDDDIAHTLIVMIENSEQYAGVTYMWGDGSAIALCPMSRDLYPYDFRGLVQHEAGGHGFGKLADEYIYHNSYVTACPLLDCGDYLKKTNYYDKKALGWFENIHHSGKLHDVPWYHLIFDPEYMGTVDIYEGAYLHTRGVFRSEPNSCMNNNIPYYSAISRESIVKRILAYAGEDFTFEKFKEHDVKTAESTKSAGETPGAWSDAFEAGHQREPVMMGDKPVFNPNKK